jgi:hypothetical protein
METKSTGKYWLYFFVWLAVLIFLFSYGDARKFFWLALPGVCTSFVKALDII